MKNLNRRHLALYATGGAAALLAAGCTQQQVSNVEAQVANFINQVQAGVVKGCQALGKLVPTANSVIAVIAALAGSSSVAVVTAQMIAQAIADITGQACTAATTAPGAAPKAVVVKGAHVDFY